MSKVIKYEDSLTQRARRAVLLVRAGRDSRKSLAGHEAEVLIVRVAVDLGLERLEGGLEGLALARLAVNLLVSFRVRVRVTGFRVRG